MAQQTQFIDDKMMAALLETDEDLRRTVAGDWMRYRAWPALQQLTREASAVCAVINRMYYDDAEGATRLSAASSPALARGSIFVCRSAKTGQVHLFDSRTTS